MMVIRLAAAGIAFAVTATPALASTVTVAVSGVRSDVGEVGCALFPTTDGFPMQTGKAAMQWHAARRDGVVCRFENVRAGTYAVAVSHDLNGNRRTDINFLGMPREDWGVSRGARLSLRAPRFEEASFAVADGAPLQITVRVAR